MSSTGRPFSLDLLGESWMDLPCVKAASKVNGTFASSNQRCVMRSRSTRTSRIPELKASHATGGTSDSTHSRKLKTGADAMTLGSNAHLMQPPHEEVVTTSVPAVERTTQF